MGQPLPHLQILSSCSFKHSDTGHLGPGFEKAPLSLEVLSYLDSSSFSINLLIVLYEASAPSLSQMLALEGHFNIIMKINNDHYLLKEPPMSSQDWASLVVVNQCRISLISDASDCAMDM